MTQLTLFEEIETIKHCLKDADKNACVIPEFISQNLKYAFFDWQKSALENFLIFESRSKFSNFPNIKNSPTHLLFNMATGSGKTIVMAALILYYFEKGYRHFLFFVNQNNIVDKTENNFIDSSHHKYLFQQKILQGDTVIPIKKVETFSQNPNGIEIKFTSIQKLYNDVHTERENQTTLADLYRLDIVMLGDEAHHLNAQTKNQKQMPLDLNTELKGNASNDEIERKGWEHLVLHLLLKKNGQTSKNVLLEFTATLPENKEVAEKYSDKIIAKFPLKSFLQQGYTKAINLISSQLPKKERVLHALLLAWYRHQLALKYGISNFKPVMLFRSKTIDESQSDYDQFLQWTTQISREDFAFFDKISSQLSDAVDTSQQGKTRTEQALRFMQEQNLSTAHLAKWVQENYQAHNVIITNSKQKNTDLETEKLLNNLEAADNPVRAIFTVDRLTEGWDVLNLFDIVRLYQGQNSGGSNKRSGKPAKATISEKQLIGRGVRYFPFSFEDKPQNQRKFDTVEHELKILEELCYYTFDEESRYISELKAELRKDGYLPENDNKVKIKFSIKSKLKKDASFQNLLIWANEKVPNPNAKENNEESLKNLNPTLKITLHDRKILQLQETHFTDDETTDQVKQLGDEDYHTKSLTLGEIERHIFAKAIHVKSKNSNSLFHFDRLQTKLSIASRAELQTLLKDWKVEFLGLNGYEEISADNKLNACLQALNTVDQHLQKTDIPFIGSKTFTPKKLLDIFAQPKEKWVDKNKVNDQVPKHSWYVLDQFAGTNLEAALINFIAQRIGNLQEKYDVHLLRNEEVLKLNNFTNGEGFMPDFILLLKTKSSTNNIQDFLCYQIFIEPKGDHLMEKDQWKEDFLKTITDEYGTDQILQQDTPHYRLFGLPFYKNEDREFTEAFQTVTQI